MDISKRLLQVIDYANISANAFAVKIGVSQPRFRNYLNGRAPDYETLSQICKTFVMINERWLLTGEGGMLKAETGECSVITEIVCKADPRDAELISSKNEIIETQKELISTLKQRIKEFESSSSHPRTDAFPSAQSVASTGGACQSKITK